MFSQEFQGGDAGVEIFSASGKSPGKQWKVSSSVHRVYDKTVKGFVFLLDTKSVSAGTLLQLPPNPAKQTLGLTQRYLVLQLRPLAKKPVTIEINILSLKDKRQRYRLHLSHKFRTVEVHQLHVQVPLSPLLTPDMWTHFIVDVAELTSYFFKNKDFGSIDSVGLHSGCRLRKMFTLPSLKGYVGDPGQFYFHCPYNFDFPVGTTFESKVLGINFFEEQTLATEASGNDSVKSKKISTTTPRRPHSKVDSKSKQSEAFEIGADSKDCIDETVIHEKVSEESNKVGAPKTEILTNTTKKRKSTNPEIKKQLSALNNRRQELAQQGCETESSDHSIDTTNFPSPLKSARSTSPHQEKDDPPPPLPIMMSFENRLPSPPSSPVATLTRRVDTSALSLSRANCIVPSQTRMAVSMYEEVSESIEHCLPSPAAAVTSHTTRVDTTALSMSKANCVLPSQTRMVTTINEELSESFEALQRPSSGGLDTKKGYSPQRPGSSASPPRPGSMRRCPPSPDSTLNPPGPPVSTKSISVGGVTLSNERDRKSTSNSYDITEQWVEELSPQESPIHNGTVFSFVDNYDSKKDAGLTESAASFTIDHDDETIEHESKEGGNHQSFNDQKDTEEEKDEWTSQPPMYSSPTGSYDHKSNESTQRSSVQSELAQLNAHFYSLKMEFVEEYGDEAFRCLCID